MGKLLYGSPPVVFELDDRTLAHVEVVVLAKLRRNESFAFSVDGDGGGRSAIWLNPSSTVQFEFDKAAQEINREWLDALMDTANAPAGLRIVSEPTK
ncbi:hypothetical protein M2152_000384 [Microbacteriaceae bacterium SG_E_30_P1]|uniref:DUF7882 domain-containing protein n=1 Tax=Antiquaquibacter oligotrophicus TaxID=2880260 RepID=A0ABT6KJM5_9MICO|nr:hypothetical protein [Antiquaquibacter oligotrophicus]MDH6180202.1 hypothetical protein [Antiquaquibacter oligotrophicus]UDF14051.1 hypothetical protein LH407_04105 [Antiquaquibacter oligotrophicus]